MDIWEKLYNEAFQVQNARVISPFIKAGGVAAALLQKNKNFFLISKTISLSQTYYIQRRL